MKHHRRSTAGRRQRRPLQPAKLAARPQRAEHWLTKWEREQDELAVAHSTASAGPPVDRGPLDFVIGEATVEEF